MRGKSTWSCASLFDGGALPAGPMLLALEFTVRSPIPSRDHARIPRNRKRRPGHPLRTPTSGRPWRSPAGSAFSRRPYVLPASCLCRRSSFGRRAARAISISPGPIFAALIVSGLSTVLQGCAPGAAIGSRIYPADGHVGAPLSPSALAALAEDGPALLATLVVVSSFLSVRSRPAAVFAAADRHADRSRHGDHADRSNRHAHHFRTL